MTAFGLMKSQSVFVEFGQNSLSLLDGKGGIEIPIERLETGQLSGPCKERLNVSIREFLARKTWSRRQRAVCAIGARGVSLRRLTLPPSTKEELDRLVRLQVESEFPLPPDELAWGYESLDRTSANGDGSRVVGELVVAAVKKGVIEEYSELLSGCGLESIFTLGAVARNSICLNRPASYAVLDIGREQSELISYENGVVAAIRVLPWGCERVTGAVEHGLGMSREDAERSQTALNRESDLSQQEQKILEIVRSEIRILTDSINRNWVGSKVFVTGHNASLAIIARALAETFHGTAECEQVDFISSEGRTAATVGLMKACEAEGDVPLLVLQIKGAGASQGEIIRRTRWKWISLAALLAIGSICFRYVEVYVRKPLLTRRVSEIQVEKGKLPEIDRELGFLQYLATNRAPYLRAITVLAEASARGTRFESISLNRRGDLSLRGTMQNSQQATDFRAKLIDSGMFGSVSVEEQTPDKNKRNVTVRITGRWKPNQPVRIGDGNKGGEGGDSESKPSKE